MNLCRAGHICGPGETRFCLLPTGHHGPHRAHYHQQPIEWEAK